MEAHRSGDRGGINVVPGTPGDFGDRIKSQIWCKVSVAGVIDSLSPAIQFHPNKPGCRSMKRIGGPSGRQS